MTNLVYQTAIEELEAVLSPRVVSRSLKEGLRQHGRSPDSVDVSTLEQILKGQVYRQLQVSMPVTEAKTTVEGIVDKLREVSAGPKPKLLVTGKPLYVDDEHRPGADKDRGNARRDTEAAQPVLEIEPDPEQQAERHRSGATRSTSAMRRYSPPTSGATATPKACDSGPPRR